MGEGGRKPRYKRSEIICVPGSAVPYPCFCGGGCVGGHSFKNPQWGKRSKEKQESGKLEAPRWMDVPGLDIPGKDSWVQRSSKGNWAKHALQLS